MESVSSDTCFWIDFEVIGHLEIPFTLPLDYLMSRDALEDELLSPPGLGQELLKRGLTVTELTQAEFELAENYGTQYKRLSVYDRMALAIAKERQIVLLTGDFQLRIAATLENVTLLGTLGLLDRCLTSGTISKALYRQCLLEFQKHNGNKIRLPVDEIASRLK